MQSAPWRFLLPLLSVLVSGCALPYYLQAATGQISILRQRVPIDELVADPEVAADTRERLELVRELRRFAFDEIGLPENESYTSYVDLGRDFVVWNVVAAEEFSVEPLTWCFPVAGCVSYRGYFEQARAEAFADRLRQRGYDTFVGGSPAYSTLGHFEDPVLNTMLARGETELAAMLFHELAHQRIYVRDDTELSESFATAVEQYAVETWLQSRGQFEALTRYRQALLRRQQFADLIARQRQRLIDVFAAGSDPESLRNAKAGAFAVMQQDYVSLRAEWGGSGEYDGWFAEGFDNARLAALTSYQRWVPALKARIGARGPADFYADMELLIELDSAVREARLADWAPR
jgi:predicted aminopeptidase